MFVLSHYDEAPQYFGPIWEGQLDVKRQGVLFEVAVASAAYITPFRSSVNHISDC